MHVHSFQHLHDLHVFERSVATIEHHATATVFLAIVIIVGVGYALSVQSSRGGLFQFRDASEVGFPSSRFADPQYAHEVAAREQMMRTALEGLRSDLQTDRAYVAVYGDLAAADKIWKEQQVIRIFEVTKAGVAPNLQRLQGLGRSNWLQMEDNAYRAGWLSSENLPKACGMELYDEQGTPVGYLGVEKTQANVFVKQDFQILHNTTKAIVNTLVRPLEQVKDSI